MAFKFIAILALAAIASAAPIDEYQHEHQVAQAYKKVAVPAYKHTEYEQEGPAEYEFSYEVNDEHTGDIKSQHETRKGDAVQGSYSLIDSDGFKRIVDYTADDIHGFVAVVRREPTDIKIPTPAPVHYQPAQKYQQAPSVHYQPTQAQAHYQPAQYTKKVAPVLFTPAHQYNQAPAHYQPQYTKVVAPVVAKVSAPIHHSAPVAKASVDYQANHVSFSGTGADYHY